jgi:hypothetical protein
MPDLTLLLQHGVLYGAILSVFMVLAFVGAAYLNPEMWLPDYPPDIRERLACADRQRVCLLGYGDYGFHFRAFLRGLAESLIGSLVVAGMVTAIVALGP